MKDPAALAEFCATLTFDRLPSDVVRTVKHIVLDTLGTTLAGGTLGQGCQEVLALARNGAGPPEATLIGFGERVPALMAALANGAMGHALNYDATGRGHLGSVLAAPFAAAQLRGGVSGRAFLCAFATGLEVMARLVTAAKAAQPAGASSPLNDTVLEGQLFGYFAAAAASARVLDLDAARIHSSFGLALMQATGSMQVVLDGDPPAKAVYAAFSNHGGLLSALLARNGLGARIAAFEGRAGLFGLFVAGRWEPTELGRGLGEDYRLLNVKFKPWPSSGVTHPFIKAALELGTVSPAEVRHIRLRGGPHARHWFEPQEDRRRPTTAAAAANSIFYVVARALATGSVGLEDFTPQAVAAPAPLVERMTYTLEEPLGSSAIVEVETRDGQTRTAQFGTPPGGGEISMTEADLVRKFMDCAKFAARPVDAERIVENVLDLDRQPDMARLLGE